METDLLAVLGLRPETTWRHDNCEDALIVPILPFPKACLYSPKLVSLYGEKAVDTASDLLLNLLRVVPGFNLIESGHALASEALKHMLKANAAAVLPASKAYPRMPRFGRLEDAVEWVSDQVEISDPTRLISGLLLFIERYGQTPQINRLRHYTQDPKLRELGYVYQSLQIFLKAPTRKTQDNVQLSRLLCEAYDDPIAEQTFPEVFFWGMMNLN